MPGSAVSGSGMPGSAVAGSGMPGSAVAGSAMPGSGMPRSRLENAKYFVVCIGTQPALIENVCVDVYCLNFFFS